MSVLDHADILAGTVTPAIDDFVFYTTDYRRHFRGMYPHVGVVPNPFTISLAATRRHPDPLQYFQAAINEVLSAAHDVFIELAYDQWLTHAGRFMTGSPRVAPSSVVLDYCAYHGRVLGIEFVFEADRLGNHARSRWHCTQTLIDWAVVESEYRASKGPGVDVVLGCLLVRHLSRVEDSKPPSWWFARESDEYHLRGPVSTWPTIRQDLSAIGVAYTISAPNRDHAGGWLVGATFRWPYAHALITDAVIGLSALNLPAYVLLWILDWLPPLHLWTEYRKIALIQGLVASTRKVK